MSRKSRLIIQLTRNGDSKWPKAKKSLLLLWASPLENFDLLPLLRDCAGMPSFLDGFSTGPCSAPQKSNYSVPKHTTSFVGLASSHDLVVFVVLTRNSGFCSV